MSLAWDLFVAPLESQAFQKALLGGSLVAIVCGVMGCFIILRRMAFLGDALSHAMLAGVTAGYLFMQILFGVEAHAPAMLIGSIVAGIVTVALISFVSKVSRIKEDTAIGIMYTGIFAVGGVLASVFSHRIHIDLYHFIAGMVLGVGDEDLWLMAIVAAIVLATVILLFRHLQLTSFDPVMAASLGFPVVALDYVLTACTSLVVVSAVNVVGVILVVGLLVTPAATAYLLCNRLSRMMMISALFGVTSVVAGLYVSTWIGKVATGPSIVIASTLQFMVVLAVAPKYGLIADWLRRRSMVPQRLVEDILGTFRYSSDNRLAFADIASHLHDSPSHEAVRRALRSLERQNLMTESAGTWVLTDEGELEAKRLLRAHRLWESYLQHVGTPLDELHNQAHQLEHLHDEETVDYLDDMLGHPILDPHGQEIPEDFMHLVPGEPVKASLLRESMSATVVEVADELAKFDVAVPSIITAGPRTDGDAIWTFHLEDGRTIHLNHDQADQITVVLVSPQD
ncbi:MAG: metal ABC transporter permease [Planctomycetales bacterium]|nr:metal ABC transporter permease [Planctomycetales bacterium]